MHPLEDVDLLLLVLLQTNLDNEWDTRRPNPDRAALRHVSARQGSLLSLQFFYNAFSA